MQSLVTIGPLPAGTVPGTKLYCRYCSAVFPCAGVDTVTSVGLVPAQAARMFVLACIELYDTHCITEGYYKNVMTMAPAMQE